MDKELHVKLKEEGIILNKHIMWFKGKMNAQSATLVVSHKRIVVWYNGNVMLGPLVKLFLKSQRGRLVFDQPLSALSAIEEEKYGMNKVLVVKAGGEEIRFNGIKIEKLREAIESAKDKA